MKTLMIVLPRIITEVFPLNLAVAGPSNLRQSRPCLHLLCPCLAWFLGLMLLAELSGCGPASSDHVSNEESRASLGAPSESQPVLQQAPAASLVTLAVPPASNHSPAPAAKEEPAPLPDYLVLPTWIAQALDAPEVSVRLRALDTWAQQGAQAPLDPLVVALDDEDDDVRTKAMAIIERTLGDRAGG